jgi:hypothetical protein
MTSLKVCEDLALAPVGDEVVPDDGGDGRIEDAELERRKCAE